MPKTTITREVTVQEAKAHFDSLVAEVEKNETEVVVTEGDRVVARIIPSPDVEAARQRFFARADLLQQQFADVPTRELGRVVDRAISEVRKARRLTRSVNA